MMKKYLFILVALLTVLTVAAQPEYRLTVSVNNEQGAKPNGGGTYEAGTRVYVYVNLYTDYKLVKWTADGTQLDATSTGFYYDMPDHDVELMAYVDYDPNTPGNPNIDERVFRTLTIVTLPANTGVSVDTYQIEVGQQRTFGYPDPTDYRLLGWYLNGELQAGPGNYELTMPDHDVTLERHYVYDPTVPANPNSNSSTTISNGLLELIIDNFKPGYLNTAIQELHAREKFEWNKVWSIKVRGKVHSEDFSYAQWISNEYNPKKVDFSRTDLTTVNQNAWKGRNSLTTVLLPECLERIEYQAFYKCQNLNSITCYAKIPPEVMYDSFQDVPEGGSLYVPASSVELYKEALVWKDFIVKPILDELMSLTINLPIGCADGRCKDMRLEVVNAKSGVRQKYIISDRMTYLFDLVPDCVYNVYLYSKKGDELSKMENIELGDAPVSITLPDLKALYDVTLKVRQPNGTDISSMVTARWFNSDSNYITTGNMVEQLTKGTKLTLELKLPDELARTYVLPQTVQFEVTDTDNEVVVILEPLNQRTLTGLVVNDDNGSYISGAMVQMTQMLNGRYKHDTQTTSDNYGAYELSPFDGEFILTLSHEGYLNKTINMVCDESLENLPTVRMTPIKTTTIAIKANGYDDYNDLYLDVYDETKDAAVNDIHLQYPYLVLPEDVGEDDLLRVTAHSHDAHFMDVTATMTVSDGQLTLDIVPLGGVQVTYTKSDNNLVRALLYDGNGKLVEAKDCADKKATFSYMPDGNYTAVLIGYTDLFNNVATLSALSTIGLRENVHYVKAPVTIEQGVQSSVSLANVPKIMESAFRFTDHRASFVCNTKEPRGGFAATFRASIGFSDNYVGEVNNLRLIIDYDNNLEFVNGSVVLNSQLSDSYALGDHTIQVDGIADGDEVKFCLTPLSDGIMSATAYVEFDYQGQIRRQPIGTVRTEVSSTKLVVKDVISVPYLNVTVKNIPYGFYPTIEIFDNGQLIGTINDIQSTNSTGISLSGPFGWIPLSGDKVIIRCNLYDPYYYSYHEISARLTADDGTVRYAKACTVYYDPMCVRLEDLGVHQPKHGNTTINYTNRSISSRSVSVEPKPKEHPTHVPLEYYARLDYNPRIFTDNLIKDLTIYKHYSCPNSSGKRCGSWFPLHLGEPSGIYWSDPGISFIYGESCSLQFTPNNLSYKLEKNPYTLPEDTEANNRFVKRMKAEIAEKDMLLNMIEEVTSMILQELEKDEVDWERVIQLKEVKRNYVRDYTNGIEGSLTEEQEQLFNEMMSASSESEFEELWQSFKPDFTQIEGYDKLVEIYNKLQTSRLYFPPVDIGNGYWSPAITYEIGNPVTGNFLLDMSDSNWHAELLFSEENQSVLVYENDGGDRLTIDYSKNFDSSASRNNSGKSPKEDSDFWTAYYETFNFETFVNVISLEVSQFAGALIHLDEQISNSYGVRGTIGDKLAEILFQRDQAAFLKEQRWFKNTVTGAVSVAGVLINTYVGIQSNMKAFEDMNRDDDLWESLINAAELGCDHNDERYKEAMDKAKRNRILTNLVRDYAIAEIGATTGIGNAIAVNPELSWAGFLIPFLTVGVDAQTAGFEADYQNVTRKDMQDFVNEINSIPSCNHVKLFLPTEEPITEGFTLTYDPSGYVYEAVPSNRIEGVTATCYYKDSLQNDYGDWEVHEVMWNAEDYDQENPQLTDEAGKYGWDVPLGLWQVRYQKDGYEPARSEWLPVPPPQLEVNIPMVQRTAPDVTMVHAYQDGVELLFSKYMMPETLTPENLKVKVVRGGTETFLDDVQVELLNEEAEAKGSETTFASYLRLTSETGWQDADEVLLIVSHSVKSYCGVPMQQDYMQRIDIEQRIENILVTTSDDIVVTEDTEMEMSVGGTKSLNISVEPADAGAGKTLRLTPAFADLMEISIEGEEVTESTEKVVTLDQEGKAAVSLTGKTEGSTTLMLTIDGEMASEMMVVKVLDPANMVVSMPVASPESGTVLNVGETVTLTTDTEGAWIWYTTDGSCPCDVEGTRKLYTAPIVITGETVLKAIGEKDGWTTSDIATFVYPVRGDLDGDGKVDSVDMAMLLRQIAASVGTDAVPAPQASDLNGDGRIDIGDVITLIGIMNIR